MPSVLFSSPALYPGFHPPMAKPSLAPPAYTSDQSSVDPRIIELLNEPADEIGEEELSKFVRDLENDQGRVVPALAVAIGQAVSAFYSSLPNVDDVTMCDIKSALSVARVLQDKKELLSKPVQDRIAKLF